MEKDGNLGPILLYPEEGGNVLLIKHILVHDFFKINLTNMIKNTTITQ